MALVTVKQAGGGDYTTIAAALTAIGFTTAGNGADDIVEVQDNAVYAEGILNNLPSGTSWDHPFILRAKAGNTPTIRNTGERNIFVWSPISLAFYSRIKGFKLDGQNLTSDQVALSAADSAPSSIDITENEFINTDHENAVYVGAFANDIRLRANHIHGGDFATTANAAGHNHAIYFTGSNGIIEDNHIHDIPGYGIHQYSQEHPLPSYNIIRRNIVHDFAKLSAVGCGILVTSGTGTKCYQNLVYDGQGLSSDGGVGISIGGSGNQGYNNTVFDCSFIGIDAQGSRAAIILANIAFGNGQNTDFTGANGNGAPVALVESNNLIGIDPLFTDSASGDFSLQAGSPAIDYGVAIDGIAFTGASPDAGAYERGLASLPTIDVTITPNPIPPGSSGTITWDTDGDTVDIPGVGDGLPPSGSTTLPPGQSLVTVQAYNGSGSSLVQQAVGSFAAGTTYKATVGYMPKSIKGGADLSVDNLEIVGLMADKVKAQAMQILIEGLSNEDLDVGRLDHAKAEIFWVNYEDLTQGRLIMPGSANIGQTKMRRGVYEAELRGKQLYLQQTIGDLYSKLCRARIGDDVGDGTNEHDYKKQAYGCRVRLDPPFWQSLKAYTARLPYDAATGSVVKPNVYNGRQFKCVTAGTSGFIEPTWDLAIGAITTDGTVEWETIQALTVFGAVTGAIDRRYFVDDARNEPPNTGQGVNTIQAQYAIRALNQGGKWFEIDGDFASYFTTGTTFAIAGSIGNDATYTTVVAAFLGTRTRITVSEAIPAADISGSIGAPLTLATGFLAYGKLTFLTGLNRGIAKEVKAFTLAQYAIVDVDTGTNTLMVDGDKTAFFTVDQRISVTGSTSNDLAYDITAVSYNSGTDQTEITVAQNIAFATVDGSILSGPALFELFERMPFEIAVGDEYVAHAGCDWSKALCIDRFDNIYNRRAEDEIPGTDVSLLFPDRPTA